MDGKQVKTVETSRNIEINRILFHYDIFPLRLTDQGNMIKAETSAGVFALKRKKMTEKQIGRLYDVYPLIRSLVIDSACPLPSKYGDLVVKWDENSYYLMPWFEETVPESDLRERYQRLFLKAGQLHRQTMQKEADASSLYGSAVQMLRAQQSYWERFFNTAEHRVYPSPFEQIVLGYAPSALGYLQRALVFFSQNVSKQREGESGRVLRRALCHGRLSPLHIMIENEKSFLINFEESKEDFYILETAALFQQASVMLPPDGTEWDRLFRDYFSSCPASDEEASFLFHFLLCPRSLSHLINQYEGKRENSELWFTKRFIRLARGHDQLIRELEKYFDDQKQQKEEQEKEEQEKEEDKN
ncbi:spore coat protein YsxE [Sporolactobacillus sp. THM7-4]|nr:spore coat protein YsxE [Sporolactobacillus sp. THM7-4]